MSRFGLDHLRSERGMGMPLAMSVLAMMMGLAAWTLASSQDLSSASDRDSGVKRALGPADAGLQHASWQLSQVLSQVPPTQCLYSGNVRSAPVGGECAGTQAAVAMGNGAQFRYVATPRLAVGATCAASTVVAGEISRCITATGTAGGVTRRVQAKATSRPITLFTPMGVIGKSELYFNNSVYFLKCPSDPVGTIGSNGQIATTNGVIFNWGDCGQSTSWSVSRGPGAPTPSWGMGTSPATSGGGPAAPYAAEPFALPQIRPWPAENNNDLIPAGTAWNPVTRVLKLLNTTMTLPAGTYDLCGLELAPGSKLSISGPVKIYIDSPTRGTGCPVGTGYLRMLNSNGLNWPDGAAAKDNAPATMAKDLHVYLEGNPTLNSTSANQPCPDSMSWGSAVSMCNSAGMAGVLYAPNSRVYLGNSIRYVGAISADKVAMNNSTQFRFPKNLTDGREGIEGVYSVRQWTECRSAVTAVGDPESGCA